MRDSLPKFAEVIGMDSDRYEDFIDYMIGKEGKDKDMLFYKISDFES